MRHPLHILPFCLVLVAACSATPGASDPNGATATTPTRPSLSLASPDPTGTVPGEGTLFTGILSMDAIEGGCAYLQAAGGRKLEVLYPEGWTLQKSPLALIAPDGSVHSRAGDTVSIRGAEAGDMASICQIGPIIRAAEVVDR